jgi:hypothetical protein
MTWREEDTLEGIINAAPSKDTQLTAYFKFDMDAKMAYETSLHEGSRQSVIRLVGHRKILCLVEKDYSL